ncbi:MAG: GDP-mannose 4,6-dehydratase [Candidatus Thermoplasmatota archaeon]|nr:NAD-dependent epimerase/dehydratase family protein [Euryarchaeota archaeon]MBU4031806.1 GDP-mannose 4,6-dehydratase [Candidatus Thermoplasmatota archaeon]MBU4071832.1 GDP-mannose 4,6-dehydratase [Candidatus Thermoplasmatota archaeon]MBU4145325.1 GDP-mannose 4,6-dehydratase [Candidatus Thermoplasmatota archaeon]MBU4592221.1 GDP-mannose 4,6-dehydratase [Candidatus Thermoplasmatota archaeon]
MKILITGASGQLGSYLVDVLSKKNDVTGMDLRKPEKPGKNVNYVTGDIGDYRLAMDLCRGKDAVIHTAAQVSVDRSISDPMFDAKENILGTVNMLETATKSMVGQFIYISSAAIFGTPQKIPVDETHPTRPLSPYGVSKLAGENYAFAFGETYGLSVTAIRPFNIYSPRQDPNSPYSGVITRFVERVKEGKPPVIQGDGSQTRDFVHADDVVRMLELCLGNPDARGQTFNCGTGKATSIRELAEIITELTGKELKPETAPGRKGDIRESVADISKAKKILGYKPTVALKKGLAELL